MTEDQKSAVEKVVRDSIQKKLANYLPETDNMPFHNRLIGRGRLATYSFIHGLNTNFGTSVFAPVAEEVARPNFRDVQTQYKVGSEISERAQLEIQRIINDLSTSSRRPNKPSEIEQMRTIASIGSVNKVRVVKADIYLRNWQNEVWLIDLKTAKPNKSNFKDFKRTLLEWVAIHQRLHSEDEVHSMIAIPYNPYAPKPYTRWTIADTLDVQNELLVGDEFWDFLGGEGTYQQLLDCFERVGHEMQPVLDDYFGYHRYLTINKSVSS